MVDKDNIDRVKIFIKGGLQHGAIAVRGRAAVVFTIRDVRAGRVLYTHDDSDTTRYI